MLYRINLGIFRANLAVGVRRLLPPEREKDGGTYPLQISLHASHSPPKAFHTSGARLTKGLAYFAIDFPIQRSEG
jgi:hypothetical protein